MTGSGGDDGQWALSANAKATTCGKSACFSFTEILPPFVLVVHNIDGTGGGDVRTWSQRMAGETPLSVAHGALSMRRETSHRQTSTSANETQHTTSTCAGLRTRGSDLQRESRQSQSFTSGSRNVALVAVDLAAGHGGLELDLAPDASALARRLGKRGFRGGSLAETDAFTINFGGQ